MSTAVAPAPTEQPRRARHQVGVWVAVAGAVVGVVLVTLLAINTIALDNETKPAKVTVPGGRLIAVPGGKLQYVDQGPRHAPVLVLLPGWTASIAWYDKVAPALARKYRVIRFDVMGFGGSSKPGHGYGMTEQGNRLAVALRKLGVRHAVVAGHSMGAVVATAMAEHNPSLVRGVVDIDELPDQGFGHLRFRDRIAFLPVVIELLHRLAPAGAIRDTYKVGFAPGYDINHAFPDHNQVVHDFRRTTVRSLRRSAIDAGHYTDKRPLDERLGSLHRPVMVIFGTRDQFAKDPKSAAAEFRRHVRGARVVLIPGVGHTPMVESPARTIALLKAFMRRVGRG